jgi:hypothetical protein
MAERDVLLNPPPLRGRVGWGVVQQSDSTAFVLTSMQQNLIFLRATARVPPPGALARADLPRKGGGVR